MLCLRLLVIDIFDVCVDNLNHLYWQLTSLGPAPPTQWGTVATPASLRVEHDYFQVTKMQLDCRL